MKSAEVLSAEQKVAENTLALESAVDSLLEKVNESQAQARETLVRIERKSVHYLVAAGAALGILLLFRSFFKDSDS